MSCDTEYILHQFIIWFYGHSRSYGFYSYFIRSSGFYLFGCPLLVLRPVLPERFKKKQQNFSKRQLKISQTHNLATFLATFKNKQKNLFKTGSKPVLNQFDRFQTCSEPVPNHSNWLGPFKTIFPKLVPQQFFHRSNS